MQLTVAVPVSQVEVTFTCNLAAYQSTKLKYWVALEMGTLVAREQSRSVLSAGGCPKTFVHYQRHPLMRRIQLLFGQIRQAEMFMVTTAIGQ